MLDDQDEITNFDDKQTRRRRTSRFPKAAFVTSRFEKPVQSDSGKTSKRRKSSTSNTESQNHVKKTGLPGKRLKQRKRRHVKRESIMAEFPHTHDAHTDPRAHRLKKEKRTTSQARQSITKSTRKRKTKKIHRSDKSSDKPTRRPGVGTAPVKKKGIKRRKRSRPLVGMEAMTNKTTALSSESFTTTTTTLSMDGNTSVREDHQDSVLISEVSRETLPIHSTTIVSAKVELSDSSGMSNESIRIAGALERENEIVLTSHTQDAAGNTSTSHTSGTTIEIHTDTNYDDMVEEGAIPTVVDMEGRASQPAHVPSSESPAVFEEGSIEIGNERQEHLPDENGSTHVDAFIQKTYKEQSVVHKDVVEFAPDDRFTQQDEEQNKVDFEAQDKYDSPILDIDQKSHIKGRCDNSTLPNSTSNNDSNGSGEINSSQFPNRTLSTEVREGQLEIGGETASNAEGGNKTSLLYDARGGAFLSGNKSNSKESPKDNGKGDDNQKSHQTNSGNMSHSIETLPGDECDGNISSLTIPGERGNYTDVKRMLNRTYLERSGDKETDAIVSVVTWNLAEESPSEDDASFIRKFRTAGGKQGSDLVLITGQECENIKPRRSEGRRSREFRRLMIKMLGKQYIPIALHLLGGIQFGLFAKKSFLKEIEDVAIADVTCGIGNVFHNKGAIAAFLTLKARNPAGMGKTDKTRSKSLRMMFVAAHMAAHVKNADARDADFWRIASELEAQAPDGFLSKLARTKEKTQAGDRSFLFDTVDRVFFSGDLNYRLDLPREYMECNILNRSSRQEDFTDLMKHDQLLKSITEGRSFPGFCEGRITFPPTFKFDKGTDDYDTSQKKRIPAWTDRILFKKGGTRVLEYTSVAEARHSDHRPVHATFRIDMEGAELQHKGSNKRNRRSKFSL